MAKANPTTKHNRKAITARAWAIFRETYKYPSIAFRSIGWRCFGACLRQAWAEAKEAVRVATIPAPVKAARIAALQDTIRFAPFGESWTQARTEIGAARAELARLSA